MIVLIGKTCSGKNTIKNILIEKYKMKSIVTVTSRPPRIGEIDGKDYYFVTKDQFLKLIDMGIFAEYTSYQVANGATWYYGSLKKDYDENAVIILNPSGLQQIRDNQISHQSFYISTREKVLRDRARARGDDEKELDRRLIADRKDFGNIITDYTVTNNEDDNVEEVAKNIWLMTLGGDKRSVEN